MNSDYVPEKDDIVLLDFSPSRGEEITKRGPAVVLSTPGYYLTSGLVIVVPITHVANNRLRDTFIPFKTDADIDGLINPFQVRSMSVKGRHVAYAGGEVDEGTLNKVFQFLDFALDR
ncbi:type II toxin-antitoxin system PemK/MazF family toxin [Weissella soli]|uniref:type II toxin-antitoxin system PemK/MazF family toxin n=1 Tax=Weissella soli TaxID=155866 RepID=UPI0021BF9DEC|nr:type II toxin-antitoxin system PemK/MazF family toxin [Weissella soli]MCT8394958.1 type II toxin-antitoxin system PemK/MazF family toxin [Weissella soli]